MHIVENTEILPRRVRIFSRASVGIPAGAGPLEEIYSTRPISTAQAAIWLRLSNPSFCRILLT